MSKQLKIIITILIVLVLVGMFFVLSFFATPKYVEEISYAEYEELLSNSTSNYIYTGSGEQKEALETLAKEEKIKIYFLNTSKLDNEQRKPFGIKEELVYVKDNEKYKSYSGDFTSYEFTKTLIDWEIIPDNIIEVTVSEYLNIIKEDTYNFMFIGSANCGYCTQFKPELQKIIEDYDVNVYYLDLAKTTQSDREALYASDKYFKEEEWGTPLSFLYKKGKRIGALSGYKDKTEVIKFLKDNKAI